MTDEEPPIVNWWIATDLSLAGNGWYIQRQGQEPKKVTADEFYRLTGVYPVAPVFDGTPRSNGEG